MMIMAPAGDHQLWVSLAAYMQGRLSLADYEWPEPHCSSLSTYMHDDLPISQIDLHCLLCGHGDAEQTALHKAAKQELELQKLRGAISTCGFFQIHNHGIPISALEVLRSHAERFFSRPWEQKLEIGKAVAGLFESFRCDTGYKCGSPLDSPVKWWNEYLLLATSDESKLEGFTTCMRIGEEDQKAFVDALKNCSVGFTKLARQLSSILLQELGVDAEALLKELVDGEKESVGLKFLHYPACPQPTKIGGIPSHTDVSLMTILWQDPVGGLQLQRDGHWLNVKPLKDSLVVNIGDIFQVWSNDRFKSGLHRVVLNADKSRLSIACFYNPRPSCILAPLPQLLNLAGEHARFRSILPSEHLQTVYGDVLQGKWQGVEYLRC